MKTLNLAVSLFSLVFSLNSFSHTYVANIEADQLDLVKKSYKGLKLTKFSKLKEGYFSTLYTLETTKTLEQLEEDSRLQNVEQTVNIEGFSVVDATVKSTFSNDPLLSFQWGLEYTDQKVFNERNDLEDREFVGDLDLGIYLKDSDINLTNIEKIEKKIKNDVVVAVIDTGIDYRHPDLSGNIYRNMEECDEKGNIKYFGAKDGPDENELAGDCMGWNFTARKKGGSNNPEDIAGHGTHVAGIISAVRNNNIGVSGLSNKIKILPIKALSADAKNTKGTSDRLAKSLLYAASMNVDVVNLSLGWPLSFDKKHLQEAVRTVLAKGITIVAAAGNNDHSEPVLPCAYEGVICVGSSDPDHKISDFSNFGGHVDILAPGNNILSTFPLGTVPTFATDNGYEEKSGTSQSAPYIAGIAALIKAVNPDISESDLKAKLFSTARDNNQSDHKYVNSGLVNANKAIEAKDPSVVIPNFKSLTHVRIDYVNKTFKFKLNLKNYGQASKNVRLRVKNSDIVSFDKTEYTFNEVKGKEVVLDLTGKIKSLNANLYQRIDFEVEVNGKTKIYSNELRFYVDFEQIPDKKEISIVGIKGQDSTKLLSINYNHMPGLNSAYYTYKKQENGMLITFFEARGDKIVKVGMTIIKDAIQLLTVHRLDVNLDGKPDYLVRTALEFEKESEASDESISEGEEEVSEEKEKEKTLGYAFFNHRIRPLFKKVLEEGKPPVMLNEWKVKFEKIAMIDIDQSAIMKFETKDFGTLALPAFAYHKDVNRPEADRLQNPFARIRRRRLSSRFYYFLPEINEKNEVEMTTRTFNTTKNNIELERKLDYRAYDQVYVMKILKQSFEDIKNGEFKVLLSHEGLAKEPKNYILSISDMNKKSWKLEPFVGENFTLSDYFIDRTINLDAKVQKDHVNNLGIVGYEKITPLLWEHVDMNKDRTTNVREIVQTSVTDILQIPLKVYRNKKESFSFFTTPSKIFLKYENDEGESVHNLPIHISTFLPGARFEEQQYPIVVSGEKRKFPALYVDATQITSRNIYSVISTGKNLSAPIGLNLRVPRGCFSRNPVVLESGDYHYAIQCIDGDKAKMVYIPVKTIKE